jgi:hypothetical protein
MALLHVFTDGQNEFYVQHCIMFAQIQFTITQAITLKKKKSIFFPPKVVFICSEHQYKMEFLN